MQTKMIDKFYVVGIAVRTTNESMKAATDIPKLWQTFMSQQMIEKIPNKVNNTLYCIYTDYESDFTKPYTTVLGCQVTDLNSIPAGFVGKEIGGGNYSQFVAKGKIMDGIVFYEWKKIWQTDLQRAYTTDFEVYGEKTQNPEDAEIDIFVSIK
jgi:predicted transcriptional regulator YdeE